MSHLPPAGWYPDSNSAEESRYWDGARWTERTAPGGIEEAPTSAVASSTSERLGGPRLGRLTMPQRVSGIAIIVVAVSAFLPWASFFGISKIGIEGDGVISLILAILGAVLLALSTGLVGSPRSPGRASQITLLVLAILVALIGLVDMTSIAAIGLYLTLFGGVTWVVGAAWQLGSSRRPDRL